MTTLPLDAVRQALDDTEAALARLRPALGAAYGIAGENLTAAAGQLDVAERARDAAEQDAERFKADHEAACRTIAEMHEAATGRTGMGPIRGVVEDVSDVRARAEQAEANTKEIAKAYDRHRRTLAAIFARSSETPFEEIIEYAARTLTRTGGRLLAGKARADRFESAWRSARHRARAHLAEQQRIRGWLTHWGDRARVAESDAERLYAAWHSARERAQLNMSRLRVVQASRRRWKRRAKTAEQRLATVRQYLAAAYPDDIASDVRDDLALILDGRPAQYAPLESQ
ncbi:hypothetical protein [Streptomyces globisporus]